VRKGVISGQSRSWHIFGHAKYSDCVRARCSIFPISGNIMSQELSCYVSGQIRLSCFSRYAPLTFLASEYVICSTFFTYPRSIYFDKEYPDKLGVCTKHDVHYFWAIVRWHFQFIMSQNIMSHEMFQHMPGRIEFPVLPNTCQGRFMFSNSYYFLFFPFTRHIRDRYSMD